MSDREAELNELLERRAREIARPPRELVVRRASALCLIVGTDRALIPSSAALGVAPLSSLTPLPLVEPHVAGVTGRRGRAIPVFFLSAILRLEVTQLAETSRIVVLDATGEPALAVDGVSEDDLPRDEDLSPPPETMASATRALLRGVTASGRMVLDIDSLLAGPLAPIEARGGQQRRERGRRA